MIYIDAFLVYELLIHTLHDDTTRCCYFYTVFSMENNVNKDRDNLTNDKTVYSIPDNTV